MESLKCHLRSAFVLIAYTHLVFHPVLSSHEYDLMDGMNNYRMSLNLSPLSDEPQAKCLADKLSDQLTNRSCNASGSANFTKPIPANSGRPFTHYDKVLSKCNIGVNEAIDAVILPVCVPDPHRTACARTNYTTLLLRYYNRSSYQRYVNDSQFTGFGADCQDDWMVLVLIKSAAVGLVLDMRLGVYLVALLLGVVGLVLTS